MFPVRLTAARTRICIITLIATDSDESEIRPRRALTFASDLLAMCGAAEKTKES